MSTDPLGTVVEVAVGSFVAVSVGGSEVLTGVKVDVGVNDETGVDVLVTVAVGVLFGVLVGVKVAVGVLVFVCGNIIVGVYVGVSFTSWNS